MAAPRLGTRALTLSLGLVAVVALVLAVSAGLARLGWDIGPPPAMAAHGSIFVLGFLGTIIGMERAVALRRAWVWLAPVASASAVLAFVAGFPSSWAGCLLVVGGIILVAAFVPAHRLQPEVHIRIMQAGAALWVLAAAGLTLGLPIHSLVPALAGFLLLTIVGERLELARLAGIGAKARGQLVAGVTLVVAGAVWALVDLDIGARISGVGLIAIAVWLAANDVARRTVRIPGITRYMAIALLLGYLWLAAAGAIWTTGGLDPAGVGYDAAIHAVFLGFVFSMVFAHAPVIIPALTGLTLPFTRWFFSPLLLLHLSLLLRLGSAAAGWVEGRMIGGLLNAGAMALFALVAAYSAFSSRRADARDTAGPLRTPARDRHANARARSRVEV